MVGRIEDPKTLVEILIFGFKQSLASSPQIVFHLHHYRSVRDEDNDVVGDDEDEDDDDGCVEGRDKRALAVRCDPFHQARPGKVAHHYLHIGPTLQFLQLYNFYNSTTSMFLHIGRPSLFTYWPSLQFLELYNFYISSPTQQSLRF